MNAFQSPKFAAAFESGENLNNTIVLPNYDFGAEMKCFLNALYTGQHSYLSNVPITNRSDIFNIVL